MKTVLAKVKESYFITKSTPVGRIDWAINDYIANNNLTVQEKNSLVMATAQEIKEAQ